MKELPILAAHTTSEVIPTTITPRAYFAAHAPITIDDAISYLRMTGHNIGVDYTAVFRTLAQMRAAYADEMLKAGVV